MRENIPKNKRASVLMRLITTLTQEIEFEDSEERLVDSPALLRNTLNGN